MVCMENKCSMHEREKRVKLVTENGKCVKNQSKLSFKFKTRETNNDDPFVVLQHKKREITLDKPN